MTRQFICMEFWGDGDPFFGGKADDRVLATDGTFRRSYDFSVGCAQRATFATAELAIAAGRAAPRRDGGLLSGLVDITGI